MCLFKCPSTLKSGAHLISSRHANRRVESSLASSATLIPRLNKANPQFIHHIAWNWADASVKSIDMSLNLKEHYSRCEPPSLHLQEIIRRFKVKLWKWRKDETHKLNFTFVAFLPHLPPIFRLRTPLPTYLFLHLFVCRLLLVSSRLLLLYTGKLNVLTTTRHTDFLHLL